MEQYNNYTYLDIYIEVEVDNITFITRVVKPW